VYVGLSDKAEILVSFDPRPSFVPLVQGCAAEAAGEGFRGRPG